MRVGVLEGPAAGPHVRPLERPVAFHVEHLQRAKPVEPALRAGDGACLAGLQQRVGGERGVPHRRDAGLAIGFAGFDDQQLVDRLARDGALGIVRRHAERVEHHHRIGHGGENRAQPVFAIEALAHEGGGLVDGAFARRAREGRLAKLEQHVDGAEDFVPEAVLVRRLGVALGLFRRRQEQLVDAHAAFVARARLERLQHQERHQHGAAPIGNLRQMEEEPARQQRDLDRHQRQRRPRQDAVERQQEPREHVDLRRAAARADRLARRSPCAAASGLSPIILSAK